MIQDLESLIFSYKFVKSETSLDDISNEVSLMGNIIGKFKFQRIQQHTDYQRILWLSDMNVKKVRKYLINVDHNLIKEFNEELKQEYPDNKWIQNHHNKDLWTINLLLLIKRKSKFLLYKIDDITGYNGYEMNRLDFDYRIVFQNIYTTGFNKTFSNKINCYCLKNILDNSNGNLFKNGDEYQYRIGDDGKYYVYVVEYKYYIFEEYSFGEYFIDHREMKINQILNITNIE